MAVFNSGLMAVLADSANSVSLSKNRYLAEIIFSGLMAEIIPTKMLAQGPLRWGLLCCLRPEGLAAQRASEVNFGNANGVTPTNTQTQQPHARRAAFDVGPHARVCPMPPPFRAPGVVWGVFRCAGAGNWAVASGRFILAGNDMSTKRRKPTVIKFSDETIKAAQEAFRATEIPLPSWRAAAAVFEAAANAQVRTRQEFEVTPGLEFCVSAHAGGSGGCSNPDKRAALVDLGRTFAASGGGAAPNTHSRVTAPAFEPGKRYRTVGGDIAAINRRDDDPEVLFCLHGTIGRDPHLISSWQENGSYGHAGCNQAFDLVPGAIGETPDYTGPTDAQLAEALFDAYGTAKSETAGWNAVASRARELLQGGDAVAAIRRAERAEAAVEAARRIIEATLLAETANAYGRGCDEKSRQIAEAMGLTITPARDLTVTREGAK